MIFTMNVVSIQEQCSTMAYFDGFVPMIVEVANNPSFPTLCWRIGDFVTTLVEIGIDCSSGTFKKLKLIAAPTLDALQVVDLSSVPGVHGTPTFDVSGVSAEAKRITERIRVTVGINRDILSIQFDDHCHPSEFVQLDRLFFLLNHNDKRTHKNRLYPYT